jgi:hypothetical protein
MINSIVIKGWYIFSVHSRKDEFTFECPCLGRLERIRIGHDNAGFGPGWFLEKVRIVSGSFLLVFQVLSSYIFFQLQGSYDSKSKLISEVFDWSEMCKEFKLTNENLEIWESFIPSMTYPFPFQVFSSYDIFLFSLPHKSF